MATWTSKLVQNRAIDGVWSKQKMLGCLWLLGHQNQFKIGQQMAYGVNKKCQDVYGYSDIKISSKEGNRWRME